MSKLYVDEIASKTGATDAMTIDSSGRISMPAKPSFFATNNASAWQSFGNTNLSEIFIPSFDCRWNFVSSSNK